MPEFFELSEGKKLTVKDVLMPDHAFRLRGQPLALPSLGPTANQISNVAPNDPIIIAKRRLGSLNLPPAKHSASYTPRTTTELFENPQPTTLETNQSPSLVVRPIPLYHGNWPSRTAEPGNGLLPMATSGSTGNSAANYFPVANSETVRYSTDQLDIPAHALPTTDPDRPAIAGAGADCRSIHSGRAIGFTRDV